MKAFVQTASCSHDQPQLLVNGDPTPAIPRTLVQEFTRTCIKICRKKLLRKFLVAERFSSKCQVYYNVTVNDE